MPFRREMGVGGFRAGTYLAHPTECAEDDEICCAIGMLLVSLTRSYAGCKRTDNRRGAATLSVRSSGSLRGGSRRPALTKAAQSEALMYEGRSALAAASATVTLSCNLCCRSTSRRRVT
jgi:hypothetical protein